jgi:hypothetical protein
MALKETDIVMWAGFIWLRIGTSGGLFFEHCYEPSGSIKGGEILDQLSH